MVIYALYCEYILQYKFLISLEVPRENYKTDNNKYVD